MVQSLRTDLKTKFGHASHARGYRRNCFCGICWKVAVDESVIYNYNDTDQLCYRVCDRIFKTKLYKSCEKTRKKKSYFSGIIWEVTIDESSYTITIIMITTSSAAGFATGSSIQSSAMLVLREVTEKLFPRDKLGSHRRRISVEDI